MSSTTDNMTRKYNRRTDDERIAELEARIADLKARQAAKEVKANPVIRDIPKIQRRLRKFAQLAMDHNRPDIANSTTAFNAGLQRILQSETKRSLNSAPPPLEDGDDE